ncbi:MAG: proline dehydrogenase family protein [Acidipropionibacterium jensenii]|nr:proline dehydrogenase family protein [Acidipropionibacterium jensenii]MDN6592495.1 proline dehydrogenase family protein [Acidipropionibacterium jensenii]
MWLRAREIAMHAATNERIAAAVTRLGPAREIAASYVAGVTLPEAGRAAREAVDKGLEVSLPPLVPTATTPAEADRATDGLLAAISALGSSAEMTGHSEVSIALSTLGVCLPEAGPSTALDRAQKICRAAGNAGVLVTVDDEGPEIHEAVLDIVRSLLADFPETGVVVQAARHDSLDQIRELATTGRRIRLCKGDYTGPRSEMVVAPHDVDLRMSACLRTLLQGPATALIATHDPVFIAIAERLIADLNRGPQTVEFQMLQGIRPLEQRRLADIGRRVRVYLPWGRDWYSYCTRRIIERPANLMLFSRSLVARR